MHDRLNPPNFDAEYAGLDPTQRNVTLKLFYESLPKSIGEEALDDEQYLSGASSGKFSEIMSDVVTHGIRRTSGDYFNFFSSRINALTALIPGNRHFQLYVAEQFGSGYISGLEKSPVDKCYWLLDVNDPKGEGIFCLDDTEKIERFEREGYSRLMAQYFAEQKGGSSLDRELAETTRGMLVSWREEFVKRYNDEP